MCVCVCLYIFSGQCDNYYQHCGSNKLKGPLAEWWGGGQNALRALAWLTKTSNMFTESNPSAAFCGWEFEFTISWRCFWSAKHTVKTTKKNINSACWQHLESYVMFFCYKVLSSMMEFQAVCALQCISWEAFTVCIVCTVNNQDLSVDCNFMNHHFSFFYL